VIGDLNELENPALIESIDLCSVIIDLVMAFPTPNVKFLNLVKSRAAVQLVQKRYIYTSGCLVYGDYPNIPIDESFPTKNMAWRVQVEGEVLKKDPFVSGVVLRPGFVYGGNFGRFIGHWFEGNKQGEIEIFGNPEKKWAWIHVNDVAEAYSIVAVHPAAAGQVFDVVDGTTISTAAEIQIAWARAAGVKGAVKHSPANTDPFSQSLENTSWPTGEKLRHSTGWFPRHGPVLAPGNAERLAVAYRAHSTHTASHTK